MTSSTTSASNSNFSTNSSRLRHRAPLRLSLPRSLFRRSSQETSADRSPNRRDNAVAGSPSESGPSRRGSAFHALLSPKDEPEEPEILDPLLTTDYVEPEHVAAFAEALKEDLGTQEPPTPVSGSSSAHGGTSTWSKLGSFSVFSPPTPSKATIGGREQGEGMLSVDSRRDANGGSRAGHKENPASERSGSSATSSKRVGRIVAASDFAPIREKTKKRGKGTDSSAREGVVFSILRYPLLGAIFFTIALEFLSYVLIRQFVNVIEFSIAWRGRKGVLRAQLRRAQTHSEWKQAALALDDFLDYDKWKQEDASGLYDWILIKKVVHSLRVFREKDDAENLLGVLDLCLRNNFAGTENFRLYSETFYGTKNLIESYLVEVEASLQYVRETDKLSLDQKRHFYRTVSKNFGKAALCLSGGASFGYYHVGVVKALLDSNLLPKVVTGTSAGGLIAALTCTRTDDELRRMLVPALADRITACEEPFRTWAPRAWRTGARFDTVAWAEKASFFTMGSMTFREAYARTGKILNISVIPSDRHSPVKLLNYVTAPECIIWSALLASAAVPGILHPVCLMQKTRKGHILPWNWGHRFKDGSLRVDIPLQELHSLFNVNYPIVSQVNPHVHLFFFAPKGMPGRPVAHRKGKGWRGGFVLSASEHVLKLHLSVNFKVIRDLDLLPALLGQDWSSVFLQRFSGAVTIWPKTRFWDWVRILTDPDRKELARMIRVGQGVTWPKVKMIHNRVRLERKIEEDRKACRLALRAQRPEAAHRAGSTSAPEDRGMGSDGAGQPPLATGASFVSDTDGDDFFSSKHASGGRLDELRAMAAISENASGGRGNAIEIDSVATTPDIPDAGLERERRARQHPLRQEAEPGSNYGVLGQPSRPRPYPSYSHYLETQPRTNTRDGTGRWRSRRTNGAGEDKDVDEDPDGDGDAEGTEGTDPGIDVPEASALDLGDLENATLSPGGTQSWGAHMRERSRGSMSAMSHWGKDGAEEQSSSSDEE